MNTRAVWTVALSTIWVVSLLWIATIFAQQPIVSDMLRRFIWIN